MASVIHINCESCGGKFVVKIPNDYQDDYQVNVCPGCGVPVELDEDMEDE